MLNFKWKNWWTDSRRFLLIKIESKLALCLPSQDFLQHTFNKYIEELDRELQITPTLQMKVLRFVWKTRAHWWWMNIASLFWSFVYPTKYWPSIRA